MTISQNRSYIPEVDQLRAMAALLVVLYHGLYLLPNDSQTSWVHSPNPVVAILAEGHSGVGLFITLSGFILALGVIDRQIAYRPFLIARVLRIYPMLLACLLVAINVGKWDLASVLTTVLPFNFRAVTGGITGSFSAMSWAVAVEFQCYLVFPFLILFSNERGSRFLFQVIAVALVLRALATLAGDASPRDLGYWTIVGRIDQFCIGIIAARLYVNRAWQTLSPMWFVPAAIIAATMLWALNQVGGYVVDKTWKIAWPDVEGATWAFFIVSYISAGRLLPDLVAQMASKLGEISYSIYLLHYAVINVVLHRSFQLHLTGSTAVDFLLTTVLIVIPVTIAIAMLTYHTIELPFLRLRPKYVRELTSAAISVFPSASRTFPPTPSPAPAPTPTSVER